MEIKSCLSQIFSRLLSEKEKDYFLIHQVRYEFILRKILFLKKNGSVLDIGCYPPHLLKALKLSGFQIKGISSPHEPVEGEFEKETVCLNIEKNKLPFADNSFDLVLLTEVLEHLPCDPLFPLGEIKRVLKKDGVFILTTPNIARSINRFSLLSGKNIFPPLENYQGVFFGSDLVYMRHNREYAKSEVGKLLEKAGFKIKKLETFISYTPFRQRKTPDGLLVKFLKILNFFLMKIFPSLRDTIYAEAGLPPLSN